MDFRSKVLEDFPHYTQINCLTGAIISETCIRHILRMNIFNDYTTHSAVNIVAVIVVAKKLYVNVIADSVLPHKCNDVANDF